MTLETLAIALKSNFATLQESEIVGRIMIISGRSFSRSLKGYELMRAQNLIEDNFIDPKTKGKFLDLLKRYPLAAEVFEKFDCIPGRTTLDPTASVEFLAPPRLSEAEVLARLKFENLDF